MRFKHAVIGWGDTCRVQSQGVPMQGDKQKQSGGNRRTNYFRLMLAHHGHEAAGARVADPQIRRT